jgi:hypothetical protein
VRGVPYVVALKPSHAWWAPAETIGAVWEVAAAGGWVSAQQPGAWVPVERTFRDGQATTWWAREGVAGSYGPAQGQRLVIATRDPATLPEPATWYLATTLPLGDAELAEVVRLYGLRNWVEQASKQVKPSLGWSQYQVRADRAMRRHWALVQCAFAFCWWVETREPASPLEAISHRADGSSGARGGKAAVRDPAWPRPWRCWPRALRRVRAWLEPALVLWRCGTAWSDHPPPPALLALLDWLHQGHPLLLYDAS